MLAVRTGYFPPIQRIPCWLIEEMQKPLGQCHQEKYNVSYIDNSEFSGTKKEASEFNFNNNIFCNLLKYYQFTM